MRHSDIKLTLGVYGDPELPELLGDLAFLPELPLDGPESVTQAVAMTGADAILCWIDAAPSSCHKDAAQIARPIALPPGQSCTGGGESGHKGSVGIPRRLAQQKSP